METTQKTDQSYRTSYRVFPTIIVSALLACAFQGLIATLGFAYVNALMISVDMTAISFVLAIFGILLILDGIRVGPNKISAGAIVFLMGAIGSYWSFHLIINAWLALTGE